MLDAQRETYGDGLDAAHLHPYMWAVKPPLLRHRRFYNWPYTFGLLFGLGLYARYRDDPDGFRAGYDDLLSSTGLADAAELAARFGIDIADEASGGQPRRRSRARIDDFAPAADAAVANRPEILSGARSSRARDGPPRRWR